MVTDSDLPELMAIVDALWLGRRSPRWRTSEPRAQHEPTWMLVLALGQSLADGGQPSGEGAPGTFTAVSGHARANLGEGHALAQGTPEAMRAGMSSGTPSPSSA